VLHNHFLHTQRECNNILERHIPPQRHIYKASDTRVLVCRKVDFLWEYQRLEYHKFLNQAQ
jgi:hypothetical protein